jgi:hypothetical protein
MYIYKLYQIFFIVQWIQPRALCTLSTWSTTESHLQFILLWLFDLSGYLLGELFA